MTAQRKIEVEPAVPQAQSGPFVINLCSSTTPMALAQHQAPELKRFSFFVSRRREEGRERFRLHMGHFMTLAEAEEWLNVVRDIYPSAWAGEAPGKKLAARAAQAAAPEVQPPRVAVAPAPAAKLPIAAPVAAPPPVVPTLKAAPAAPAVSKPTPPPQARPPAAAKPAAPKALPSKAKVPQATSNVREVLKSLDDTGDTRAMPAPAPSLSDSQVLKVLENRRPEGPPQGNEEASKGIALLRPDDTSTVRALKEAVRDNAPVSFAVQLQWSVQPIDLAKMPPLAIFSAYTLYTVEGSRDGRKWYGLRLGFFGDAISAKQVASYVRSEFTSVAVLPVSLQERGRATNGHDKPAADVASRPRKAVGKHVDEFKLIDDETDDVGMPGLTAAQAQLKPKKPAFAPAPSSAKRGRAGVGASSSPSNVKKTAGRVRATEKRSPKTLEETLEILGASELAIDNGRGELLNDSGVRHLSMERVQKNSPFAKLLERLSEKVKKS